MSRLQVQSLNFKFNFVWFAPCAYFFMLLCCNAQQISLRQQQPSPSDTPNYRRRVPPYLPAQTTTTLPPWLQQQQQQQQQTGGFRGLAGSYCAKLPNWRDCCERSAVPARSDDRCAVPVQGTTCYCDQFCDRYGPHPASANDPSGKSYFDYGDCCPDYWSYCSARRSDRAAAVIEAAAAPTRNSYYTYNNPPQLSRRPQQQQQRPLAPPAPTRDEVADYDEQFTEQRLEDYEGDNAILRHVARTRGETRRQLDRPQVVGKALETLELIDDVNNVCTARTRDGLQYIRAGQTARINCNDCSCVSSSSSSSSANPEVRQIPAPPPELICTQRLCLIEPLLIDAVNADFATFGWQAGNYTPYWGRTLQWGVKHRLGTHKPKKHESSPSNPTSMNLRNSSVFEKLPENFDARDKWPRLIGAVVDQGACAASWAYGTVQTAQDRYNVRAASQHEQTANTDPEQHQRRRFDAAAENLSVEQLVACDGKRGQHGCHGGKVDKAWAYLARQGVVDEFCYPTEIDWLTTSFNTNNKTWTPTCKIGKRQQSGMLEFECPNDMGGRQSHPAYRYVAQQVEYLYEPTELDLQLLLVRSGPLQAVIRVRPDFFMYSDGVYAFTHELEQRLLNDKFTHSNKITSDHRKHHDLEGHHSVRIVGWGVDYSSGKPVKFWECANSWGTWWGREGYFRIRRGSGESDVENFIINAQVVRSESRRSASDFDSDGTSLDYENEPDYQSDSAYSDVTGKGRYRRRHDSESKLEDVRSLHLKQQENFANILKLNTVFLNLISASAIFLFLLSNCCDFIRSL